MDKLIAYYRVSTRRQGKSGLGLEAQEAAVRAYAKATGGRVLASYTEVESGKRAERPELAAAVAHARRSKARLVIAKLDRLARNVAFTSALMESGCDFVACDNPHANRLTIHILAAVAEDEARRISDRTKAALGAAKRRGVRLGSARPGHWKGREAARKRGARRGAAASVRVRRERALAAVEDLVPRMRELREGGASLREIAAHLNEAGQSTPRGSTWTAMAVKRALDRAGAAA